MSKSKVLKAGEEGWAGVEVREYKAAGTDFKDVTRRILLGDVEGEEALGFITRYFEVMPGGYSSLERHHHPHAVVVLKGSGRVLLGRSTHEIGPRDCIYVSPGTVHQFQSTGSEPLGFLCIVDRNRDRAFPVRPDESGNPDALPS
jgi:mannose-6-phosphate isomerase-like protein (cupin superfamily)